MNLLRATNTSLLSYLNSPEEKKRLSGLDQIQDQVWYSDGKQLPDDQVFKVIVDLALKDHSVKVRIEATFLLGFLIMYGDKRTVEPLIKASQDSRREVRVEAVNSMEIDIDSRFPEHLKRALQDRSDKVRFQALSSITLPNSINILNNSNKRIQIDSSFVDILMSFLDHPKDHYRTSALYALAYTHTERALDEIIQFTEQHVNCSDRISGIVALREIGGERAVECLKRLAQTEKRELPLKRIKEALEKIGNGINLNLLLDYTPNVK